MNLAAIDPFIIVLLAYALIVEPLLGRREISKLRRALEHGVPGARMSVYRRIIVLQWIVTTVFLVWWLLLGRSATGIGLHFTVIGRQWIAVGVCLAITLLFAVSTHRASRKPESLGEVRSQLGSLVVVVPHTDAELKSFSWVSLTAGICEELAYRGLLLTALTAVTGLWPAVLLSSLAFGLGHAYQGPTGIVRTGLVGLLLALAVVFTGSLPVAMLMHTVLDIVQGRLLRSAVSYEPPQPAVSPA